VGRCKIILRKTILSVAVALCLTAGVAPAQEKKPVPLPPKPDGEVRGVRVAVVNLAKLVASPASGNADAADKTRHVLSLIEEYSNQTGVNVTFDISTQNTPIVYAANSINITEAIAHPSNEQSKGAEGKIVSVNIQIAIAGTAEGKQAAAQLQEQNAPRLSELAKLMKDIQDKQARLQGGESNLSNEERVTLQRGIEQSTQDYAQKRQRVVEEWDTVTREHVNKIGGKMLDLLNKYAAEHKIVLVMDTGQNTPVVYVGKQFDITQRIIALYDQAYPSGVSNVAPSVPLVQNEIPTIERIMVIKAQDTIRGSMDGKRGTTELATRFAGKPQQADVQVAFARTQQVMVNRIGRRMIRLLETYADATNTGLIVDSSTVPSIVVYAAKPLDLTQAIIQKYDQTYSTDTQPTVGDAAPRLDTTLKFIQDKMNENEKVVYVVYVHDNLTGNDWNIQQTTETIYFTADALFGPAEEAIGETCRFDFHQSFVRGGKIAGQSDAVIFLKTINNIAVMASDQYFKESDRSHPEWSYKGDPMVFVLKATGSQGSGSQELMHLFFYDEQIANRVAKALVHAVELCGGGSKEPF
jgi:outer membrane protein